MSVRIAVIGSGGFAREHVRALAQIPEAEVVWAAGSDLSRAQAVAGLAPGARGTTDIMAAVEDPSVDAVDICNATPGHERWALAAARAGKHVHVDKPVTLSLESFDAMVGAANAVNRTFMVGQTVRFQPAMAEVARAISAGEVGEPRLLHVAWYVGHVWPNGWRGWQHDIAQSGGHPVHNGIHCIDLAVWLMKSQPRRIFARDFPTFGAQMPMPDSFHLLVEFTNGSLAVLELSYALRQRGDSFRRLVLAGTQGSLVHDVSMEPGLMAPSINVAQASVDGALVDQLRHWISVVKGDEPCIVRPEQARAALAAALAAQRSLGTGQPVSIDQEVSS